MRIVAAVILTCLGAVAALAIPETTIGQKGHVFSMLSLNIKKGEIVRFLNDDKVPHNIMSMTEGNEFNLGSQGPGTVTPVGFDQVGVIQVICAIHPRMRMTITVNN